MQTLYVSMARDLIGVYLVFRAESTKALEQYIIREWELPDGNWRLPWCAIYTEVKPSRYGLPLHLVKAQCGDLYEESTERSYRAVVVSPGSSAGLASFELLQAEEALARAKQALLDAADAVVFPEGAPHVET